MTLLATTPTLTPSATPSKLGAAAAPLLDLATKTAELYKAIMQERAAMALQAQDQPIDEEFFFEAVTKLSKDHTAVEQSIRELETQFKNDPKIKQVASQIRGVLNGDAPTQAMDTTPSQPAVKPTAVESAENAYSALAYHLESGSADEQEKQQLGLNLFNAFKEVKKNGDPIFRKSESYQSLSKAYDSVMQEAFAPKVPALVQESFTNALQTIANAAEEISANKDLVQKYIDTQLQEKKLLQEIPLVKRAMAEAWNNSLFSANQEGSLVPNNLYFKHPLFGQINTDLSVALEQFEAPFNRLLDQQYGELLPYIDTHYTARQTAGDGNCLFHTIAHLTNSDHVSARKAVTQHMSENPELFEALIEERMGNDPAVAAGMKKFRGTIVERYAAYMEQNSVWGGKPELQALSNITGRPVIARQKGAIVATISFFPTKGKLKTRAPLLILNSGGHFEPLIARR